MFSPIPPWRCGAQQVAHREDHPAQRCQGFEVEGFAIQEDTWGGDTGAVDKTVRNQPLARYSGEKLLEAWQLVNIGYFYWLSGSIAL